MVDELGDTRELVAAAPRDTQWDVVEETRCRACERVDLLWIPCAKTPAGRRTLEVPNVHLIAATLGHEDERTTMTAYAAPGAAAAGANRRSLVLLNGGLLNSDKSAK